MSQEWIHWQGQKVADRFELCEYLSGCPDRAVFVTNLDSSSAQKAAIKLIKVDRKNAESQLANWNSVKHLSHPHLIRLFGIGEHAFAGEHWSYVVMEYAEENLATILSYRPLTPTEAREMLQPTLEALAYLHANGFVHGHIKPSNIMAVGEQLKISSDGIMRAGQPNHDIAKVTPYLPSEAASGRVSSSADVWSLGVTLVEALTQEKLGPLSTAREREAVFDRLPASFRNIAEQCLRADPEQRCTIAGIQNELGGSAVPVAIAGRRRPEISLKRSRSFAPVGIVVLLLTILGGVLMFKHREPKSKSSVDTIQSQAPSQPNLPAETKAVTNSNAGGKVVQQVLPDVSKSSLRTIHGTVRVNLKVHVNPSGKVENVVVLSEGPSRYFANRAMEAAKKWTFAAPTSNGKSVPSDWKLEFQFKKAAARVNAMQVTS
jgi:TonB family protein